MSTDLIKLGHLFADIASGREVSRFEEIVFLGYPAWGNAFTMRSRGRS